MLGQNYFCPGQNENCPGQNENWTGQNHFCLGQKILSEAKNLFSIQVITNDKVIILWQSLF